MGEEKLNNSQTDHQLPVHERDGENKKDEHRQAAARIERGKGGQHAEDGAGGADAQRLGMRGEPNPAEAAQNAAEQVHGEKMFGAHGALGFGA